jgi:hypothetical protein
MVEPASGVRWKQFDSAQAKRQLSEGKQGLARWVALEGNAAASQVRTDFVPKSASASGPGAIGPAAGGSGPGGEEDKATGPLRSVVARRAEQSSAEDDREAAEQGPAARLGKARGAHAELVELLNEFNYRLPLKPKKKMLPVELAPRPPRKAPCGVCEQFFSPSELRTQQLRVSVRELRRIFAGRRSASAPAAAPAQHRARVEPEQHIGHPVAVAEELEADSREQEHGLRPCEPEQPPCRRGAPWRAAGSQRRPRPLGSGPSGAARKARPARAIRGSNSSTTTTNNINNNCTDNNKSRSKNEEEEGDEDGDSETQLEGRTCSRKYKMSALYDRVWVCGLCSQFFPVHEVDDKRAQLLEASLQAEARLTGTIFTGEQWTAHVKHKADLIAAIQAAAVKAAGAVPSKGVVAKLPRVAMLHSPTCERREALELEDDLTRLDHEAEEELARGGASPSPTAQARRKDGDDVDGQENGASSARRARRSPDSSPRPPAASPRDYAGELHRLGELVGLLERRLDGELHVPGLALKMQLLLDNEERRMQSARQHGWIPLGAVHDSGAVADGAYFCPQAASPLQRHPRALEAQRAPVAAAFNVSVQRVPAATVVLRLSGRREERGPRIQGRAEQGRAGQGNRERLVVLVALLWLRFTLSPLTPAFARCSARTRPRRSSSSCGRSRSQLSSAARCSGSCCKASTAARLARHAKTAAQRWSERPTTHWPAPSAPKRLARCAGRPYRSARTPSSPQS